MEKWTSPIMIAGVGILAFAFFACIPNPTFTHNANEQRVLTDNSLQLDDWPKGTDWSTRAPVTSRAPLAKRAATWTARKAQP